MRNQHIDNLRGFGTLLIILIHVLALYLGQSLTRTLWNLTHSDVPIFVFCSAYLFFSSTKDEHPIKHIWRRIKRLIVPYYLYVIAFYTLSVFANRGVFTWTHISRSLLIMGGIDISWLVLLFVYNAIILSVLKYWLNQRNRLFEVFGFISIVSSIVFVFWHPAINYRWYMWLPWSAVLYYSYLFLHRHTHRLFFATATGLGLLGFIILLFIKLGLHHDLTFYNNKYPPNAYYLLYGLLVLNIFYFLSLQNVFENRWIKSVLRFSSRNSYTLFFVHYFLVVLVTDMYWQRFFRWYALYIVIVAASFVITAVLNQIAHHWNSHWASRPSSV